MSYTVMNFVEDLSYDRNRGDRKSVKPSKSKSWKKRSRNRAQWVRHGAGSGTTAAEKLAAVLADEAAAVAEWTEMHEWLSDGVNMDEAVNDLDSKPELDEQELAYWEAVFQCA